MSNQLLTVKEFEQCCASILAQAVTDARQFCYDLFIEQQMNEGIDSYDGTSFGGRATL